MRIFWISLTLLTLFVGLLIRRRVMDTVRFSKPGLDDETIREIERTGVLPVEDDEPLCQEEIDRAEEEFWGEYWDEPEPL